MNATAELEVVDNATENRHLLVHMECITCHNEGRDTALCGYHLAGPTTDEDVECVVCNEIATEAYPFCPTCGVDWRIPPRGGAS